MALLPKLFDWSNYAAVLIDKNWNKHPTAVAKIAREELTVEQKAQAFDQIVDADLQTRFAAIAHPAPTTLLGETTMFSTPLPSIQQANLAPKYSSSSSKFGAVSSNAQFTKWVHTHNPSRTQPIIPFGQFTWLDISCKAEYYSQRSAAYSKRSKVWYELRNEAEKRGLTSANNNTLKEVWQDVKLPEDSDD